MGSDSFADQLPLSLGNRERVLLCNDPVPERPNVANLLIWAQLIETRRWIGDRLRHTESLAFGSDKTGVFSHETALMLHQLSDALPSKRHMSVPASWSKRRLRVPKGVVLHYAHLGKTDVSWKGPVQVTTPLRTVLDCTRDAVAPDLVRQAITQGVKRGLFSRDDVTRVTGTKATKRRANETS